MRKLNIGPGPLWRKAGWHTLDYYQPDTDIVCDLRSCPTLPIASASLDKVFCSHVIEHLSQEAVKNLLSETRRVLAYGGTARFSCPDLEKAVAHYRGGMCDPSGEVVSKAMRDSESHLRLLNVVASFRAPHYQGVVNTGDGQYSGGPVADREEVNRRLKAHDLQDFADWVHTLIPSNATYLAHVNAFWAEKLERMMKEAGFDEVDVSRFRKSSDEELRGRKFDNRPHISLFVESRAKDLGKYFRSKLRKKAAR